MHNCAILLTPPSPGAIAVVRLLGRGVGEFLRIHFSKETKPGHCVHGTLFDGDRVIDDPVIVLFPDGSGADVSLHGGTWVVQSMLDLAAGSGFAITNASNAPDALEMADGDSVLEPRGEFRVAACANGVGFARCCRSCRRGRNSLMAGRRAIKYKKCRRMIF